MITVFLLGFILGVFTFLGYGAYRALRSDGWDDSNFLNWLRLLSHVYIHPEDFVHMYYLDDDDLDKLNYSPRRPFSYIAGDEFADNFPDSRYK